MNEHDRQALVDFVYMADHFIAELVERRMEFVAVELRELLSAAWQELIEQDNFEATRAAILSGEYDAGLDLHGLSGAQLELKVFGAQRAIGRWQERGGRRLLKKAMVWVDVLLNSVADVVPGAGAITELKDAAKASVEDRDGGRSLNER